MKLSIRNYLALVVLLPLTVGAAYCQATGSILSALDCVDNSAPSVEAPSQIESSLQDGAYIFIWTIPPYNYSPSNVAIYSNVVWVPYHESRADDHYEEIEVLKLRFKRAAADSYGWEWTTGTGPWVGGTQVVEQTSRVRETAEQMLSDAIKRSRDAGMTTIHRILL